MRFRYVSIKNFRSVQSVQIDFSPRCRSLVGINESGKTNILRALSLLDPKQRAGAEDLRDFLPDEDHDQEAYVRFVFALDKAEREATLKELSTVVLTAKPAAPILHQGQKPYSLAQFRDAHPEALLEVAVRTNSRQFSYWRLSDDWRVAEGWFKTSEACPEGFTVTTRSGDTVPLRNFELIHDSALPEIPEGYLEPLTPSDVNTAVGSRAIQYVMRHVPGCLYWSYSDAQLLPAQIPLEAFAANPATCEPLKEMFNLAGIDEIGPAIAKAKERQHGIRNLLNRVATTATKHLRSVWKDYRGVEIALEPNGTFIDASVRDTHNVFQFSKRSDGFKRFVTFLLLVSAKARTDGLVDTLYLQDEPDTGLHPSGSRYLRDELIRIAEKNYVVFSTHSIFMIDREKVDRHLIVEKKDEVTQVRAVNASNITDEEVIYNALGYSLFETLRHRNIVFEGYKDKLLFQTALRVNSPKAKALKKRFADVGLCHARGVKDVGRITPLLELARRQWVVLSDTDKPAREQQRSYEGQGPWLRYDDLLPSTAAVTGEDFLVPDAFRGPVKGVGAEFGNLPAFDIARLSGPEPKLIAIQKWLREEGLPQDKMKEVVDKIKQDVFDHLKPGQVAEEYFDLLAALADRLDEQEVPE